MPKFALAGCCLAASLFSVVAVQADELTIEGVGISRDVTCSSNDVGIYGAENTIQIKGQCDEIKVHGKGNKVSFEKADEVSVSGAENVITGGETNDLTVESAKNQATATLVQKGDDKSELEVEGADNTVTVTLTGKTRIEVGGAKHKVTWSAGPGVDDPQVSISGAAHQVKRAD